MRRSCQRSSGQRTLLRHGQMRFFPKPPAAFAGLDLVCHAVGYRLSSGGEEEYEDELCHDEDRVGAYTFSREGTSAQLVGQGEIIRQWPMREYAPELLETYLPEEERERVRLLPYAQIMEWEEGCGNDVKGW
jgi:hypothetical protein